MRSRCTTRMAPVLTRPGAHLRGRLPRPSLRRAVLSIAGRAPVAARRTARRKQGARQRATQPTLVGGRAAGRGGACPKRAGARHTSREIGRHRSIDAPSGVKGCAARARVVPGCAERGCASRKRPPRAPSSCCARPRLVAAGALVVRPGAWWASSLAGRHRGKSGRGRARCVQGTKGLRDPREPWLCVGR